MACEKKAKCRATRCLIFQFNNLDENTKVELNIEPDRSHMDITNGRVAAKLNRELSAEAASTKGFYVTGTSASHLKVKTVTYCKDRNCKRIEAAIYGDKKNSHFYFFKSYLISLRFDDGELVPFLQLEVRSQSIVEESRFFEYSVADNASSSASSFSITTEPFATYPFQFLSFAPTTASSQFVQAPETHDNEQLVLDQIDQYFRSQSDSDSDSSNDAFMSNDAFEPSEFLYAPTSLQNFLLMEDIYT